MTNGLLWHKVKIIFILPSQLLSLFTLKFRKISYSNYHIVFQILFMFVASLVLSDSRLASNSFCNQKFMITKCIASDLFIKSYDWTIFIKKIIRALAIGVARIFDWGGGRKPQITCNDVQWRIQKILVGGDLKPKPQKFGCLHQN